MQQRQQQQQHEHSSSPLLPRPPPGVTKANNVGSSTPLLDFDSSCSEESEDSDDITNWRPSTVSEGNGGRVGREEDGGSARDAAERGESAVARGRGNGDGGDEDEADEDIHARQAFSRHEGMKMAWYTFKYEKNKGWPCLCRNVALRKHNSVPLVRYPRGEYRKRAPFLLFVRETNTSRKRQRETLHGRAKSRHITNPGRGLAHVRCFFMVIETIRG